MKAPQTIAELVESLGFEAATAQIYETLWLKGPQTISELARTSNVERTKVYRLLPQLQQANLIEIDNEYGSDIIHTTSAEHLMDVCNQQQEKLLAVQHALPVLATKQANLQLQESRVNVYRGTNGLKQLLWNETKATTEVLSILQEPIQTRTNSVYFERWVAKCNQNNLHFRGVVGDKFSASRDQWYSSHVNERLRHWQERHIDAGTFAIDQNVLIYDDVVAYFMWGPKELFGVEIHNAAIAQTQRQFFEMLWQFALLPVGE